MSALFMRSRNSAKTASVKRTYSQETTDSVVVSKKSSVASQKSSELTKSREKLTCASLKNFYTQYGLSHLIPLILLIAYTLIGGWIYFWIEHDAEIQEKTSKLKELRDSIGKLRHDLYLNLEAVIMNPNTSRINKLNYTKMAIEWYEEQLQIGVDSSLETYNWDIWNSMFFASTIFTTIGYGSFAPGTSSGQLFTIFYAILGIPLVLAILNDLGQVLCRKANEFWSKCTGSHGKVDPEDCRTEEEKQADSERSIPATLAIFITLFWLFGCSALFLIWESEWSYLKSFYFFFISLSTIGLGDVTFSNPKFMLANFPLVLIGLSLVSMCFNVIQEKIEEFVFGLIRKFQDEYDKLSSELQESLSPEERDVILKEIWAKQPIYVRAVLPLVMSEKHHDQLVSTCTKIASIGLSNAQVQTDSCANDNQSVQTALDTVEFNQQTDSNSVMQRSIQATSVMQECDMQTSTASLLSKSIQISIPMAERDMQTSQISSQSVLNSTSMQTSLELQSAQMQTSLLCGDSSCQTDFPIEDNNKTEESGIQAGEPYWDRNNFASQTVNPATNDLIMQTSWVEDSKIDQTDKIMQTSSIAPLFYTHNSSENSVDLSDKVSQTDESYLAKAKKLEELRLRKTDSLNVMCATPSHNRLIKQKKVEK